MRGGHGGSGLQQRDVELTERQRQVLRLIAAAKTNAEIGTALGISLDGAKWHVSEILTKLEVASREEAAAWWAQRERPVAKVGRVLRLLLTPGAWKLAAAGAAVCVIGGVTLGVVWLASDDGDAGEASSPSIPSTATSTPNVPRDLRFPSPEAAIPGHGPDVRTGNGDVDAVIDALLPHSAQRVAPLLTLSLVPCGLTTDQLGGPLECLLASLRARQYGPSRSGAARAAGWMRPTSRAK